MADFKKGSYNINLPSKSGIVALTGDTNFFMHNIYFSTAKQTDSGGNSVTIAMYICLITRSNNPFKNIAELMSYAQTNFAESSDGNDRAYITVTGGQYKIIGNNGTGEVKLDVQPCQIYTQTNYVNQLFFQYYNNFSLYSVHFAYSYINSFSDNVVYIG